MNTPLRLALWCRKMRDLFRQVEHSHRGQSPVHLLEKAWRCADHLATRLHTAPASRPAALAGTSLDAAGTLEALAQWCDVLVAVSAIR